MSVHTHALARRAGTLAIAFISLSLLAASPGRVLDDFESGPKWIAAPSDGVDLRISHDAGQAGKSMRLDYDFRGGGGYAIARIPIVLELPQNYEFSFWIRAVSPVNTLEFKVVDHSGDNVWWVNRRAFRFPTEWTKMRIKRRHLSFAWGPSGGKEIRTTSALEIVITASTGGKGTVWIDGLTFTPLEPEQAYNLTPVLRASSSARTAAHALDADANTQWHSSSRESQWLQVDFGRRREFGGLVIDWDKEDFASRYEVQFSDDGKQWQTVWRVDGSDGGRDHLFLPESDARYVRLRLLASHSGRGYGLREITVQPLEFSSSRSEFFRRVAADSSKGTFPKYFGGVQSYWTIVGVAGDEREALINEEGAIEIDAGGFSLEPFLRLGDPDSGKAGQLLTWADIATSQSLEDGDLPIPTVAWNHTDAGLSVTTWAAGQPRNSVIWARYRITNKRPVRQPGSLHLAIRPFQVNPPWQFLAVQGGASEIRSIGYNGELVKVDQRTIVPLTRPDSFAASRFDEGELITRLRNRTPPSSQRSDDPFAAASGFLTWSFDLQPGASEDFVVAVPLWDLPTILEPNLQRTAAAALANEQLLAARIHWQSQLGRVAIDLPDIAQRLSRVMRSNLAFILINMDGPSIQPGSRSYDRSWIRDGSLTSAALLRLGHSDEVKRFLEWYAGFQYPNGKIPCCVDSRGADPVDEHDSHGQFIYLAMETWRFTKDRALLERVWPNIVKAVGHIDELRQRRRTAEFQTEAKRAFFGLVPESISHEGYSAKAMHSYWDDFFILKGLKDAVGIATVLGHSEEAKRFAAIRDEFRGDLYASLERARALHKIDYIPGSVELGDFDATSTTTAVAPGGELRNLPRPALDRTFDKYYEHFLLRQTSTDWEAYTPYEWRVAGTFIRLGQAQRARDLIDFFFGDIRPAGWNQWAEVVFRDPKTPKFIGDMPHTWVGSDFIRSMLDMFAYERDTDESLVLGAGIPLEWVRSGEGIRIRSLRTFYGSLSYSIRAQGGAIEVRVEEGLDIPPGGLVVVSPVDGKELIIRKLPATLNLGNPPS